MTSKHRLEEGMQTSHVDIREQQSWQAGTNGQTWAIFRYTSEPSAAGDRGGRKANSRSEGRGTGGGAHKGLVGAAMTTWVPSWRDGQPLEDSKERDAMA